MKSTGNAIVLNGVSFSCACLLRGEIGAMTRSFWVQIMKVSGPRDWKDICWKLVEYWDFIFAYFGNLLLLSNGVLEIVCELIFTGVKIVGGAEGNNVHAAPDLGRHMAIYLSLCISTNIPIEDFRGSRI